MSIPPIQNNHIKQRKNMARRYPISDLITRFNGKCQLCGCTVTRDKPGCDFTDDGATRGYLIPLEDGGKNCKDNVVLSCRKCNREQSK